MTTTEHFKEHFTHVSEYLLKEINKHPGETSEVKLEENLNCYKNFIVHSFDGLRDHVLSLHSYYRLLPLDLISHPALLISALLELNEGGYILVKRDFFRYFIVDNQKQWIDLPCDHNDDFDYLSLIQLYEKKNKINWFKKKNKSFGSSSDEERYFNEQNKSKKKLIKITEAANCQVEELDQMSILQNIIVQLFIKVYLSKESPSLKQQKILKELEAYNHWVIKNKQEQFSPNEETIAKIQSIFVKSQLDENIKEDVKKAILDSESLEHLKANYFDSSLNKKIEKEIKENFDKLEWPVLRDKMIANHLILFNFLKESNQVKKKKRITKIKEEK